jgi:serine/threonine protein kinase
MPGSEAGAPARVIAGRYRLLRVLGRGGIGVVWLADDQLVDRKVAVKELRPPPGLPESEREVFTARALREARSAARIHHPNAVILYDVLPARAADDAVYLIMEFVDGPSLAELVRQDGVQPDAVVVWLGLQLLDVLEAAHGLGVVHRDIKPGNLMIADEIRVKLTDFGIAHTLGSTRLTRSGTMGTPAYIAPELLNDQPITPAADLWSLGATLYYAVEGEGPFDRDTTAAVLGAILVGDIPVPRCSPGLADAISGMLQRDPAQRATIEQARAQLRAAARPAPGPMPHPRPGPEPEPPTRTSAAATTVTKVPGRFALRLVQTAWVAAIWGGGIWALELMGNSYNSTRTLIAIVVFLATEAVATLIMVWIVRRLRVGSTVVVEVRRQRVKTWRRAWRRARS